MRVYNISEEFNFYKNTWGYVGYVTQKGRVSSKSEIYDLKSDAKFWVDEMKDLDAQELIYENK